MKYVQVVIGAEIFAVLIFCEIAMIKKHALKQIFVNLLRIPHSTDSVTAFSVMIINAQYPKSD